MERAIRFDRQADHFTTLAERCHRARRETYKSIAAAYRVTDRSIRIELWWPSQTNLPNPGERRLLLPALCLRRAGSRSLAETSKGDDEIGRCEGLLDQDAIGNAERRPFVGAVSAYVDDRNALVQFTGMAAYVPAAHLPTPKVHVCNYTAKVGDPLIQDLNRVSP